MFRAFGLALLIIAVIGSIIWGFNRHERVLDVQQELDSTQQELSLTRTELNSTQAELSSVQEELDSTQQELSNNEWSLTQAEDTISNLRSELELYKDTWGSVVASGIDPPSRDVDLVNSEDASDPTWTQLLDFLRQDKTNQNAYVPDIYVCRHFAMDVHNSAELSGIRAAYVRVICEDATHAINAFRTTDAGLVFIDCTGVRQPQPDGPNHCEMVDARLGEDYVRRFLFPRSDWTTRQGWGSILDVEIYW